jgi:hypothetical protein
MKDLDTIITESLHSFLDENLIFEKKDSKKNDKKSSDKKKKKKRKFKKNAIKMKGGLRKDFDSEDDETYNQNISDREEDSITGSLNPDFVNISAVAQKLYPDHTPEGAQSQLRKKLKGETSDSGSKYKIKTKEAKKLRAIISTYIK